MKNTVTTAALPAGKDEPRTRALLDREMRDALNHQGVYRVKGFATAAGTGATEIWRETLPTDCTWRTTFSVVGRSTDGAQHAVYEKIARWKSVAGTVTQLGSLDAVVADYESDGAFAMTVVVDGADIALKVDPATHDMNWDALIHVRELT